MAMTSNKIKFCNIPDCECNKCSHHINCDGGCKNCNDEDKANLFCNNTGKFENPSKLKMV